MTAVRTDSFGINCEEIPSIGSDTASVTNKDSTDIIEASATGNILLQCEQTTSSETIPYAINNTDENTSEETVFYVQQNNVATITVATVTKPIENQTNNPGYWLLYLSPIVIIAAIAAFLKKLKSPKIIIKTKKFSQKDEDFLTLIHELAKTYRKTDDYLSPKNK